MEIVEIIRVMMRGNAGEKDKIVISKRKIAVLFL
jgi:hypothetical protein